MGRDMTLWRDDGLVRLDRQALGLAAARGLEGGVPAAGHDGSDNGLVPG